MLTIRLSRQGRSKRPFFRVVLTEHTKPAKCGYKEILGFFDPLKHTLSVDIEKIKTCINQGAQPSERVAKLLFKETNDQSFKKFIVERERHGVKKKEEK
ncbi:MAG: 30S ribosomal protein S16 [Patescibacteria group bacterium]|nr:30S ribosomal protein S16 [Patescibacteria group bacterium]